MKIVLTCLTILIATLSCACSGPSYTWSYEHAASPVATSSYIRAVLARDAGDYELALLYYDRALSYEKSSVVQQERDEVEKLISQAK